MKRDPEQFKKDVAGQFQGVVDKLVALEVKLQSLHKGHAMMPQPYADLLGLEPLELRRVMVVLPSGRDIPLLAQHLLAQMKEMTGLLTCWVLSGGYSDQSCILQRRSSLT